VLNEDVCLDEGCQEFFMRGRVVCTNNSDPELVSFIFLPTEQIIEDKGLLIASSIVKVENGYVPVRVIKPECSNIILRRGTKVGELEELNSRDGYYEDVNMFTEHEVEKEESLSFKDFNLEGLSVSEKEKVTAVILSFSDVFSKSKMDIGCTQMISHNIDTGDSVPIAVAPRRIPAVLEEKVDRLVQELLEKDIVQPSESPWSAPLVIVAKKNGDVRMCVDYRRLNAVTKRPIFPIPATQQLLDSLEGSTYFSTLDLSQGYYQIPVKEEDISKTAFTTRRGQFEFKRMPMGLSSSPSTFQRLMHIVLKNENWEKCLIYLDDILVFGRSIDEHMERLKAVLQRFREAGLKLSPSKCFFLKRSVSYLGHIISTEGVSTDPAKIDKVKAWPVPTTRKQLRSFLGFCGYYRRFIQHYSEIVRPLESLCSEEPNGKKTTNKGHVNITRQWGELQSSAFNSLKLALTTTPVLAYPNESGTFILDADASDGGIGAVLSQMQGGLERVISYASRKLTKSERRYCVTRKELLAVYNFIKYFRHYLFGRHFIVRTDHKALLWMLNWRKPNTSQYCLWKAELELYDLEIQHRPGKEHLNADALSRLPDCRQCQLKHNNPVTKRNSKILEDTSCASSTSKQEDNFIMRLKSELPEEHWNISEDPELSVIVALMKAKKIHQKSMPFAISTGSRQMKEIWNRRERLRIRGDVLYLVEDENYRLLVPVLERRKLISRIHTLTGHGGMEKLIYVMKGSYYWPGMENDIKKEVQECIQCQLTKGRSPQDKAPLQSILVGKPFERIAIDICGPFRPSKYGFRYILALIDYFSKYPVLIPLKRIDAETVARNVFHKWIAVFGAPEVIHSDRGSNFESELFQEQCRIMGIKKTRTSPYYPQADGLVERLFRTIKPLISATVKARSASWCEVIPFVEMGLRCSVQATTGMSPFEILFGKKMRLPTCWETPQMEANNSIRNTSTYIQELQEKLKEIHQRISQHMKVSIQRQADYYNGCSRNRPISIGDMVLVRVEGHIPGIFPRLKYEGPFEVIATTNKWTYKLKSPATGKIIQRNYNQVKRWYGVHKAAVHSSRKTSLESLSQANASMRPQHSKTPAPVMDTDNRIRRYPMRNRQPPLRLFLMRGRV
jgi:transposase InsO family protein